MLLYRGRMVRVALNGSFIPPHAGFAEEERLHPQTIYIVESYIDVNVVERVRCCLTSHLLHALQHFLECGTQSFKVRLWSNEHEKDHRAIRARNRHQPISLFLRLPLCVGERRG